MAAVSQVNPVLGVINFGILSYLALPIFTKTEKVWRKRKVLGYDVQVSLLTLLCIGTGQYVALSLGYGFHYLGQRIVSRTQDDSKKLLTDGLFKQSTVAWVIKDGMEVETPLEDLNAGDKLVVVTGEVIPVDGIIVSGDAMIDQQALTGESQPAEKGKGEQVFASTLIVGGKIYISVEKAGNETTVAKIHDILNKSVDYKTKIQLKGEKWADQTALPMMSLSALALPLIGPLGATAILSSSFGNRLRVIAPLGTFNHISVASHKGIFIKDGRIFELVHTVDTILFDKTGTLTEEQPKIGAISPCDQYSESDILKYAAAAESKLAHPIADAIVQAAEDRNLVLPEVDDSEYKVGYGITVKIADKIVKVGSIRFIQSLDVEIPEELEKSIHEAHQEGHSSILVVINDRVIGSLEVQTQVRPEVKEMIGLLRKRGIKYMAIVSGDHKQPTEKLANLLKMDNYFFDVLPEDKASIVEKLQNEGKTVAFIGDGINDAIAMKKAHVSISLSGATSLATDTAQIILLDGNLSHLDELFEIGQKLDNNLRNSFILTLVPGVFTIFGAFFLGFTLIQAILVSSIGLVLGLKNAMNPLKEIKEINKVNKGKIEYNAEKSESRSKSV